MSRMYSRKKGKSGSTRPLNKKADWVSYKPDEVQELVVKLADEGKSSAEIGTILRDKYGVPLVKKVTGKSIITILKEKDKAPTMPEDMYNLLKKAMDIRTHLSKTKKDRYSKRGLELTESKIRRLGKYYVKNKELPDGWKYDPDKLKVLTK